MEILTGPGEGVSPELLKSTVVAPGLRVRVSKTTKSEGVNQVYPGALGLGSSTSSSTIENQHFPVLILIDPTPSAAGKGWVSFRPNLGQSVRLRPKSGQRRLV